MNVQCASLLQGYVYMRLCLIRKKSWTCVNSGTVNLCWHWLPQRKMQEAPLSQIGVVYLILYQHN